ncbi:uncharacterized protein LOC127120822 isoform X3 [Lathyrus oleraceus]|uniref:uncharacterized protein LOC127120822 isoform X3 n=1 Tax=Pisum sativum TaxID=3888 RepID=UPI001FC5FFEA|nr:uncharacterized protein LOC127120822 isoform X3 [Pisum sativum]
MTKPERPPSSRTNLASCVVATIFLVFVFIIIFTLYFTLFKPQDPKISVTAVQLPSFSLTNNGTSANLTFSQYASVRNPNRGTFSHYDSSFQLLCYGRQIGFMFVPAGKINARRTEYMAATFTVQSLPLGLEGNSSDGVNRVGPTMEIESTIEMAGRVRVLNLFSHHVEAKAECRVAIAVADGTVIDLKSEFHPTKIEELKMEEYLVKMKNLGDKLKLAGAPMSNFDLTIQTLKDLDLDYNSVVVKLSDQINLSTGPVKHEYSILDKVPVPGTHTVLVWYNVPIFYIRVS